MRKIREILVIKSNCKKVRGKEQKTLASLKPRPKKHVGDFLLLERWDGGVSGLMYVWFS